MARLTIHLEGRNARPMELNWGITRIGRGADNDIVIDHPSVSTRHCEFELGLDFLAVRDCGSTNGTFINGQQATEAQLDPGQTLRLGHVPVTVEWSREQVSVPVIEAPKLAASVDLGNGVLSCVKHETAPSLWYCPKCHQYLCPACTRDVHLVGRPSRRLCSNCSAPVELAPWAEKAKKPSLWGRIKKTFSRTTRMR